MSSDLPRLRVRFETPVHGWLGVALGTVDAEFSFLASFIPKDSLSALVDSLHALLEGRSQEVVWEGEPTKYVLALDLDGSQTAVRLRERAGSGSPTLHFAFEASTEEVCLSFWRGLRNLQSKLSPEEFERQWSHPFPAASVERLALALGRH